MPDKYGNFTATELAEIDAWCAEVDEEQLQASTREQLLEEIRSLRAITQEHEAAKSALKETFRSLWYPYGEALPPLFELQDGTEATLTMTDLLKHLKKVTELVGQMHLIDSHALSSLARHHPDAAAAFVAERRYHAEYCTHSWPASVRHAFLANVLADVIENDGLGARPPICNNEIEYWAAILDKLPPDTFDVIRHRLKWDPSEGDAAKEAGWEAGYHDDNNIKERWKQNLHRPGSYLYAVWERAYRRAGSAFRVAEKVAKTQDAHA